MPRRPRPWYRHDPKRPDKTGWWVTVGGQLHLLHRGGKTAADREIAETKFHELMFMAVAPPESPDANIASICDAFLVWSKKWQSEDTFRGYRFYIQAFCEACGYRAVSATKPYHVNRFLDERTKWRATTRYNAVRSILRVFNWAKEERLIDANPLKGMKRPTPNRRTRYMTDEEFSACHRAD